MEFDLAEQRAGAREQLRIADLMSLAPGGDRVLEIGARDCYLSRRLTALYREVTALDLRKPEIDGLADTTISSLHCPPPNPVSSSSSRRAAASGVAS